jgi:hypothetical protein
VGKKPVESGGESNLHVHGQRAARSTVSKSSTVSDVLRCEHPGCTTTFRRNKDRLPHFRHKHESNPKRFLALWLIAHLVSAINTLEATNYVIICAQRRLSTSFTGPACYLDAPKY